VAGRRHPPPRLRDRCRTDQQALAPALTGKPEYTSAWGDQNWRRPYQNVTRHEAAATVMGARQGPQGRAKGRL